MKTPYLIFDKDTEELVDVISLTEEEKDKFEESNPDVYLEEDYDDCEFAFDDEEDDFYEELDEEDEW